MDKQVKNNILFSCLILSAIILLGTAGWFVYFKFQFVTYTDKSHQFTVKYPLKWKLISSPSADVAVVFQSPKETALDVFQENINVTVQIVPDHIASLGSFSSMVIKQMNAVFETNIKIIENKDVQWNGRSAHVIVFESPAPNALKSMVMWTIKKDKVYFLMYMGALDKYKGFELILNEIVSSFRLLKAS